MSNRINISFKESELDQELLEYLKEQSKLIGPSAYMKQLLYEDMLRKISDNNKK